MLIHFFILLFADHDATKAELESIHARLLRESEEHAATHDMHAAAHEEKDEAHARAVEEFHTAHASLEQEVVDLRDDAEELHGAKCAAEATVQALRVENAELGRQLQIALVVQDDSMAQHCTSLEHDVRALQTRLAETQLARNAGARGSAALSAAELAEHWQAVLCADDHMGDAEGSGANDAGRGRGMERFAALRSENARLVDQIGALREVHDAQRAAAALELRRKALSNVVLRHALRRAKATIALLRWNRSGNGAQSARRAIEIVRTHRDETRRQLKQLALARWTTGAARWRTWMMKSAMTRLHQHGAAHVQRELAASRTEGECSFMYRYIVRESCSQFDSLPLTSLTISRKASRSRVPWRCVDRPAPPLLSPGRVRVLVPAHRTIHSSHMIAPCTHRALALADTPVQVHAAALNKTEQRVAALQKLLKSEITRNDADAARARNALKAAKGLELKCSAAQKVRVRE